MTEIQRLPLAVAADTDLSVGELLQSLRRRRLLPELVTRAMAHKLAVAAARASALSIEGKDLVQAANRLRRQLGLGKEDATHNWLQSQGLTANDFEAILEEDLLIEKFRQHLAESRLTAFFEANASRYSRARLKRLVVASEGLARELWQRIEEEGADFATLAQEHSLDKATSWAEQGKEFVFRCQLPAALGDAVFAARTGDIVGPLPTAEGFVLLHVLEVLPPELDDTTRSLAREHIFAQWLAERMQGVRINLSALESIS